MSGEKGAKADSDRLKEHNKNSEKTTTTKIASYSGFWECLQSATSKIVFFPDNGLYMYASSDITDSNRGLHAECKINC